jgi:hypothetical protein
MKSAIEHELTWAYYRMRRHPEHPVRRDITQQFPPTELGGVTFWQDLRPPFIVKKVRAADEGQKSLENLIHPDGELYNVTYDVGLEYTGERKFDTQPGSSTFDTKVHGIAQVRFSHNFPGKREFHLLSWGKPTCVRSPGQAGELEAAEDGKKEIEVVDPRVWNPLGVELALRPNSDKLARVTSEMRSMEAKQKAMADRPLKMSTMKSRLLGPHEGLQVAMMGKKGVVTSTKPSTRSQEKVKLRHNRIYTSCGGFLKYAG